MNIAIYGYGNLGKGVEAAIKYNPDMTLFGVFTRRDPASLKTADPETRVYSAGDLLKYKDEIDVLVICGGSATDLPKMTPELAKSFNVVDSFDTHAKIPEHFDACDAAEIYVKTDTGDVTGTLLSDKKFFAESDTGKVSVPKSVTGGRCEISTDTGRIDITVK